MDKLFPRMYDCPESKQIAQGGLYWFFYIILLPFLFAFVVASGKIGTSLVIGTNTIYFIINGIAVFAIFREYLIDSFLNVSIFPKRFFLSVGSGLLVFYILEFLIVGIEAIISGTVNTFPFPAVDMLYGNYGFLLLWECPLLMGLCLLTIVPVTMSCLYYAVGFASPCQNRVWLGYLVVALISAIPAVLQVTSIGVAPAEALRYYVEMLPFHMCACWAYQRSDSIWGAIAFQSAANLLSIPSMIILMYLETLTGFAA